MYHGDLLLGTTLNVKFNTNSSGAPATLVGGAVAAYVGNSATEITAGITLAVDFDGRTGMHNVTVVASGGNGFAANTEVQLVLTAGTVGGVAAGGNVIGNFSIEARPANVKQWNGVAIPAPATAGIPDVNVKNINNVAAATPGAVGGGIICGNNAAVTVAKWTCSGTTIHTGNVSYADGITLGAPSTLGRPTISITAGGDASALKLIANGTGDTISIEANGSGHAVDVYAYSGNAFEVYSEFGNGFIVSSPYGKAAYFGGIVEFFGQILAIDATNDFRLGTTERTNIANAVDVKLTAEHDDGSWAGGGSTGGTGAHLVTLLVTDNATPTPHPVGGVAVSVYHLPDGLLVGSGTTDAAGHVVIAVDAGSFRVALVHPLYYYAPEDRTLTFAGTPPVVGGTLLNPFVIALVTVPAGPPGTVLLSGTIRDEQTVPVVGCIITVELVPGTDVRPITAQGNVISFRRAEIVTNGSGFAGISLIPTNAFDQTVTYKITSDGGELDSVGVTITGPMDFEDLSP